MYNELIQQARSASLCSPFGSMIRDLCNALESAQKEIERKDYAILGIMHSVDKWLDGDELNQDEVNRAVAMRENTLRIVEALTARVEKAEAERDTYKEALAHLEHMVSHERSRDGNSEHSVGVAVAVGRARKVLKGE